MRGKSEGKEWGGKGHRGGSKWEGKDWGKNKCKHKGGRGYGDALHYSGLRGTFIALFVVAEDDANEEELSDDLRDYAPQVMTAHCPDEFFAESLAHRLSEPKHSGVHTERKDLEFKVVKCGSWLLCGRKGIVQELSLTGSEEKTAGAGELLIAEVQFAIQMCNQMQVRFAVWNFPKRVDGDGMMEEELGEPSVEGRERTWDWVQKMLTQNLVRLIVGDFGIYLKPLLRFLRASMKVDIAAYHEIDGSAEDIFMLWVGPASGAGMKFT